MKETSSNSFNSSTQYRNIFGLIHIFSIEQDFKIFGESFFCEIFSKERNYYVERNSYNQITCEIVASKIDFDKGSFIIVELHYPDEYKIESINNDVSLDYILYTYTEPVIATSS